MEFQAGNVFIRTNERPLKQGEVVKGHSHHFDHVTYCTSGALRVERKLPDGRYDQTELRVGDLPLLIKAECYHTLTALEHQTGYHCIYSHRLPTGEITERYTGWADAYN
jgi:quercetin dioxygenase-like cupin family protein